MVLSISSTMLRLLSAGDRDPDADGVEGMSASRLRLAASENDFRTFKSAMPEGMRPEMQENCSILFVCINGY